MEIILSNSHIHVRKPKLRGRADKALMVTWMVSGNFSPVPGVWGSKTQALDYHSITHSHSLVKINLFLPGCCQPPVQPSIIQKPLQWAHTLLLCSLAQTGVCFWNDGSLSTRWRMWPRQPALEAVTSEFHWIYRLLEWLTLGKVKSGSSSKQQRIEKQINGSSVGSFPTTLSDAVTSG